MDFQRVAVDDAGASDQIVTPADAARRNHY
jgi:hypothetical protein